MGHESQSPGMCLNKILFQVLIQQGRLGSSWFHAITSCSKVLRRNQPPWTQKVNWTYARRSEDVETAYWNVLYKFNVCFVAREFIVGRGLLTPPFYEKPLSCLLFFFKFCPIPRWLHWLLQIWSVTLLNNIMDIHMLSLGILIPEGPSYVFYATRDQIYWGLRHFFLLNFSNQM